MPDFLFHYKPPSVEWDRRDNMVDEPHYTSPRSQAPHVVFAASGFGSGGMKDVQPVRRERDPPKNGEGQIFCDHTDCEAAPPTFRRPSEWK